MDDTSLKRSVFREGDRREAEQFLGQFDGVLMVVLMLLTSIFVETSKFRTDFGAGDDLLGVDSDLVESIGRSVIFGLDLDYRTIQ